MQWPGFQINYLRFDAGKSRKLRCSGYSGWSAANDEDINVINKTVGGGDDMCRGSAPNIAAARGLKPFRWHCMTGVLRYRRDGTMILVSVVLHPREHKNMLMRSCSMMPTARELLTQFRKPLFQAVAL
jgi:hypothetical protein